MRIGFEAVLHPDLNENTGDVAAARNLPSRV
jgi:hypothetical protein